MLFFNLCCWQADQARRLKIKQQQIRAQKNAEDAEIRAIMQELQAQKEEELRARMERERLKKVLHGAGTDTLSNLELVKQRELKALSNERQSLKEREDTILREIKELEDEIVEQVCDSVWYSLLFHVHTYVTLLITQR